MTVRLTIGRTMLAALAALSLSCACAASEFHDPVAEGAPGVIPHAVDAYLPITIDRNACLRCHRETKPGEARVKGGIPASHYAAPGRLSGERFECMVCHATGSNAAPLPPADANDATH